MDTLKTLFERLPTLPTWVFFSLAVTAAFVLFGWGSVADALALHELVRQFPWARPAAGLLLVFSVVAFAWKIVEYIRSAPESTRARKASDQDAQRDRLRRCSLDEKILLAEYVRGGARTRMQDPRNGVVGALERERILERTTTIGKLDRFPFAVAMWAWTLLSENPALIAPTAHERARLVPPIPIRTPEGTIATADDVMRVTFPFVNEAAKRK